MIDQVKMPALWTRFERNVISLAKCSKGVAKRCGFDGIIVRTYPEAKRMTDDDLYHADLRFMGCE